MNQIWKEESVYIYSLHLIICWLMGKNSTTCGEEESSWLGSGSSTSAVVLSSTSSLCVSGQAILSCFSSVDVDNNRYLVFLAVRWAGMDRKPTIINDWMNIQALRVKGWLDSEFHSALTTPKVKRKISRFSSEVFSPCSSVFPSRIPLQKQLKRSPLKEVRSPI